MQISLYFLRMLPGFCRTFKLQIKYPLFLIVLISRKESLQLKWFDSSLSHTVCYILIHVQKTRLKTCRLHKCFSIVKIFNHVIRW